MSAVAREKEMDVPVEALFKAITDFTAYPEFVSEVVGVEVQKGGTPEKTRVAFELDVIKRFKYTLEFKIVDNKEVSWTLVDSNFFKTNSGKWILKSLPNGKTHATYSLDVSFGFLVPGWISKKLTETNLPRMMESFETQARKIQGKS